MSHPPILDAIARRTLCVDLKSNRYPNTLAALRQAYAAGLAAGAQPKHDTEASLRADYDAWIVRQVLPRISADELILEPLLTDHQRAWLGAFLARWNAWELRDEPRG